MSHRTTMDTSARTPLVRPAFAWPEGGTPSTTSDRHRPVPGRARGIVVRTVGSPTACGGAPGGPATVERLAHHLVVVPLAGTTTHEVDFETHQLRPGRILHVRPGQAHRRLASRSERIRELRITDHLCPDRLFVPGWFDPALSSGCATVVAAVEAISADLEALCSTGADGPDLMAASADYLLRRLAPLTRALPGAGTVQGELVEALLGEIELSFTRTRAVGDYARSLGASARTLSRATAALLDRTPKELVDQRVVLEARRLLAATALPVAEVAETLGFSEATNFTKFFVRHAGVGPLDFRVDH